MHNKLVQKSIEAFIMSIEIYNKPTIDYRVEGFAFFICNAWELLLKANLINTIGNNSIYFKDNPDRTITLELCIKKVFTNEKAPNRLNLEELVSLRNTSTHFIIEEYEEIYIGVFQACVTNYCESLAKFFNINIEDHIKHQFLNLQLPQHGISEELHLKYPSEIVETLMRKKNNIELATLENNSHYAYKIIHEVHLVSKPTQDSIPIIHNKEADLNTITMIKVNNPSETHKFTAKKCVELLNKRLEKENVTFLWKGDERSSLNINTFISIVNFLGLKEDSNYCYAHKVYKQPSFSYSNQAIEKIIRFIKKNSSRCLFEIMA